MGATRGYTVISSSRGLSVNIIGILLDLFSSVSCPTDCHQAVGEEGGGGRKGGGRVVCAAVVVLGVVTVAVVLVTTRV